MFILLALIVIFLVSRLAWFYVAFETSLIPITLIVLGWGYQPERLGAARALILYTIVASLPLLVIIFYLSAYGLREMGMPLISLPVTQSNLTRTE